MVLRGGGLSINLKEANFRGVMNYFIYPERFSSEGPDILLLEGNVFGVDYEKIKQWMK